MGLGVAFLAACSGDTTAQTDLGATADDAVGSDLGSGPSDETLPGSETTDLDTAPLETGIAPDSDETDTGAESETTAASDTNVDESVIAADVDLDTGPPADTDAPSETATPATNDTNDDTDDTSVASDATWPADRPHGQCATGTDCPGDLVCADTAPGGICNGCGAEPCPDGTSCNQFGACSRDCTGDADCPAGLRCHGTHEVCVLVGCALASDCTPPYACEANFCRRPSCVAARCPAPFVCAGDVCVEPYFAP